MILGYLAAAAAGLRLDRSLVSEWFARQGLAIREHGLKDGLARRRARRGADSPSAEDPADRDWIRDGLDFDATKLDLDLAVVVFPGADRPEQLPNVLQKTKGVLRIYEGYERDLVVVVVYDGAAERRRLQTFLEEQEPRLRWLVVREVDDSPAASTWLSLALRVAKQEQLLTS